MTERTKGWNVKCQRRGAYPHEGVLHLLTETVRHQEDSEEPGLG